jgi:DNA-binding transcriptional LysR family regulator
MREQSAAIHRIQEMDWRAVDLNLLVVFQALLENRGVTRAGEALGLSQPAMSANLARLRDLFGDPLFVRSGAVMKPTSRAMELASPVRRVLESIRSDVFQRADFDPLLTAQTFTIITPDVGEAAFLPPLLSRLRLIAPGAILRTISRPPVAAAEALESGEADLAIGHFPDLHKAGFFQQKLRDVVLIGLVRKGHPTLGEHITMDDYLAASHVVVRPAGRGLDLLPVPRPMRLLVAVEVAHFMSVLPILEQSDLLAAVPRDLADICTRYAAVRAFELPFEAPTIPVHQFWHERFHKDASHCWLRAVIKDISERGEDAKAGAVT